MGDSSPHPAGADLDHLVWLAVGKAETPGTDEAGEIGVFGTDPVTLENQGIGRSHPTCPFANPIGEIQGLFLEGVGDIGAAITLSPERIELAGKGKIRLIAGFDNIVLHGLTDQSPQSFV